MKKNFLSENHVQFFFKEPRLVKGQCKSQDRWYIEFWQGTDPSSLVQYRHTFDLNRIKSKRERKDVADNIIELIDSYLEKGDTAQNIILNVKKIAKKGIVKAVKNPFPQRQKNLIEAIDEILSIKITDAPQATKDTFKHVTNHFKRFIEEKGITQKFIVDFNKSNAIAFMDYFLLRGVSKSTYNNRLTEIKNMFNELLRRDYILENPFIHIPLKKIRNEPTASKRRVFTDAEAYVVGKEIFQKSIWLLRAILLENYCGVRPAEMRRLKFKHFNFKLGVIDLNGEVVFKSKSRIATIPKAAIEYFLMPDFTSQPTNNFVFGKEFKPNPKLPVSRNYITKKHREILVDLHKRGVLANIEGLELYSWKNTGITNYANDESIGIFKTQNQVGHHSPTETMRYYRQSPVDEAIRKYDKKIF